MILSQWLIHGAIYVITGIFAGLMSGILGVGGGIVVVPALLYIFQYSPQIPDNLAMHFAAGTSPAIMIFTSQSAIRSHFKWGEILWTVFRRLWPGIAVGVIGGAYLASYIPTRWLEIFLSIFLLFVAVKMTLPSNSQKNRQFPSIWVNNLVNFLIGFQSGLLGVGGGALVIPYLTYCGIDVRKIAAVSSLCTMTVSVIGTFIFIITGFYEENLPHYATGYIYWPAVLWVAILSVLSAPLGAKLNYILPVKQLRLIFVVILICTSISLLI